jgi:hypothetical protein
MAKVDIYGTSDDLIVVEDGVIEEFILAGHGPYFLAFGEGTVLSAQFGSDEIWRIERRVEGSASFSRTPGTDPDDNYSDRVTLQGSLKYVVFGNRFERIRDETGPVRRHRGDGQ